MRTATPQQEDVLEVLRDYELESLVNSSLVIGAILGGTLALGYALGRLRR